MHYLKQLLSGFSLGVLFTIETAFYATPPANAQPAQTMTVPYMLLHLLLI